MQLTTTKTSWNDYLVRNSGKRLHYIPHALLIALCGPAPRHAHKGDFKVRKMRLEVQNGRTNSTKQGVEPGAAKRRVDAPEVLGTHTKQAESNHDDVQDDPIQAPPTTDNTPPIEDPLSGIEFIKLETK